MTKRDTTKRDAAHRASPAQAVRLAAVIAAVVLAVVANVLAARHFTRWDWTSGKRYTLTPATLETLRALDSPVDLWVILGAGDPLEQSVKQILVGYQAESRQLNVHYIDPDKDGAALVDVRERFGVVSGKTEDGRVVTDAVMIVARGDRHWFVTASDLFEVGAGEDVRAKPREEQAITGAIRAVVGGERSRLCFTAGHGELTTEPSREGWIGAFKGILEKDNYEVATVDTTAPDAHEPFAKCDVVVVARPLAPFAAEEANRLRTWLMQGGSALVAVGPMGGGDGAMTPPGLAPALAPFGIGLTDALVLDPAPSVAIPDTNGEGFFLAPKAHAVTQALVAETPAQHPPRIAALDVRPLEHVAGEAVAADLLTTSEDAYAVRSLKGAAEWRGAPPKKGEDARGPFVVAMAAERPKSSKDAAHGARLVVVGSGYMLAEANWGQPRPVRGAAFFVESAISWLSSRQQVLDVPERPEVAAGIRITEESRQEVMRYVLLYMPLAAILLGLAVALRRRSTEGEAYAVATSDASGQSPGAEAAPKRKKRKKAP